MAARNGAVMCAAQVRTKAARVLELQEQYRSLGVNVVHK